MIKEKSYKYKDYQISYDEGLKDRSALVIGIKDKDTLYITGELYDESANAVIKILNSKDKEIERLNNIINELEKYSKDRYYEQKKLDHYARLNAYKDVWYKIKELKGSDKNG